MKKRTFKEIQIKMVNKFYSGKFVLCSPLFLFMWGGGR
jgi:hypothetical protein